MSLELGLLTAFSLNAQPRGEKQGPGSLGGADLTPFPGRSEKGSKEAPGAHTYLGRIPAQPLQLCGHQSPRRLLSLGLRTSAVRAPTAPLPTSRPS